MSLLENLVTTQIFSFLIIFARIGCALMLMPGFSDATVAMNIRLYVALSLSLVLTPVLYQYLPAVPGNAVAFTLLIARECLTGFFIGMMSQIIMNALGLAGIMIAHVTSLSSAFTFNPQQSTQLTVVSSFLSLVAVTLIFVTDFHHMLLLGLIDSYQVFAVKGEVMLGDMVDTFARSVSQSMHIGLMMSAPFVIVGFGIFIGMGLVARFVPQIQVFALSVPVQLLVGMVAFMTTISAVMLFFLQEYEAFWRGLFAM